MKVFFLFLGSAERNETMTKNDLINDIIYSLEELQLNKQQLELIKFTFLAKMSDYELKDARQLPAIDTTSNEELLKRFIIDASTRGLHKSTIQQYIKCVNRLFDFTGKDFRQITGQDINDWIAITHYTKILSQTHRANLCTWCCSFFNWAYKKHYLETDITRDVERIKPKQKPKDVITEEEIELIRNSLKDDRERALFELMICTGMRVGEIANTKIGDIDFIKKTIKVYAEKTDTFRTLNLTNRCVLALKIYIKERDSNDYVFKAKYKNQKLEKRAIENIAKKIGERVGCHSKTTVHLYRKTLGTMMNSKTGDMHMTMYTLGHASIAITEKYYVSNNEEDMAYKYKKAMN